METVINQAFVNAGQKPGVEIWRIENFEPVSYPSKYYGKFYDGDSYIILKTTEDPKSQKLSWDIHFWLGTNTTTDEAGAAAICTVQLDDQLEGAPVQHREVQDHESQLFLSYFKNGVRYEKGGIATGFEHVDVNAVGEKRLFQVKGKRNVRVRQVELSITSMNRGDCFILDAGEEILVYVGEQAKRLERLKAIYAANEIRDQDHHGRSKVNIIDNFSSDVAKEYFFSTLGSGSPDKVPDETADEEDGAFEVADNKAISLYKVSDASGSLEIEKIAEKPLRQEMLNTDDSFILDTGTGIYVWVGRGSTQKEKTTAMQAADHFLDKNSYPSWTQVQRIVEDGEPAPFKQYFASWHDQGMHHKNLVRTALGYSTDDSDYEEPDDVDAVVQNLKKSGGHAIAFMPDNGENDIEHIIKFSSESDDDVVRSIVDFDGTTPLFGHFAYIITYKYSAKSGESGSLIYVWEGAKASDAVKERSYNDGIAMAREQNAILIRTAQSHEPRHFLKIFKGKLITPFNEEPKSAQLFRIRGTDVTDVHASEVNCDASSLASGDVFALVTLDHKVFIWVGEGASEFEKTSANEHFAHYWSYGQTKVIAEGDEPSDFWEELHGEGEYDRSVNDLGAPLLEPRLFHCQLIAWRTKVEEVRHFEQADLDVDDIMLLDAGDEIYLWVGSGANEEENAKILQMAKKYIKQEPTDRTIDTLSIIRITQGNEPRVFTRMFPTWDKDFWKKKNKMQNDDDDDKQNLPTSPRKTNSNTISSGGPTDVVESVSEKAIAGRRLRNGVHEYYSIITLDVKNAYNNADWEEIMLAIQQNPDQLSDTDSMNIVDGIEISTLNQTHWNAISDAVARQKNPKTGAQITGVADDIALEVIKRHLTDVERASNAEVVLVKDWLNTYGLKLAERKTDAVLKSRIKKVEQELVKEGNILVKSKPEIGYLGLLLNTKLKFMQHLQYADKLLPQTADKTVIPSTSTNVKGLGKLLLVMNVSTAALLYPSTKRDLELNDDDKKLKLVVETKYNIERKLVSGENENVSESARDAELLIGDANEQDNGFVNLVFVDERKRWKMKRTESLPDVRFGASETDDIYESME